MGTFFSNAQSSPLWLVPNIIWSFPSPIRYSSKKSDLSHIIFCERVANIHSFLFMLSVDTGNAQFCISNQCFCACVHLTVDKECAPYMYPLFKPPADLQLKLRFESSKKNHIHVHNARLPKRHHDKTYYKN